MESSCWEILYINKRFEFMESGHSKIHLWAYSKMRPNYVKKDKEYRILKYLLHEFIHSKAMLDAAEGHHDVIQCIHNIFHNHVFVHENLYLYFKRMTTWHFEVLHFSLHEVCCSHWLEVLISIKIYSEIFF